MGCYQKLLNITYKDQVTFDEVRIQIQAAIGEYNELLTPDNGKETKTKIVWFQDLLV